MKWFSMFPLIAFLFLNDASENDLGSEFPRRMKTSVFDFLQTISPARIEIVDMNGQVYSGKQEDADFRNTFLLLQENCEAYERRKTALLSTGHIWSDKWPGNFGLTMQFTGNWAYAQHRTYWNPGTYERITEERILTIYLICTAKTTENVPTFREYHSGGYKQTREKNPTQNEAHFAQTTQKPTYSWKHYSYQDEDNPNTPRFDQTTPKSTHSWKHYNYKDEYNPNTPRFAEPTPKPKNSWEYYHEKYHQDDNNNRNEGKQGEYSQNSEKERNKSEDTQTKDYQDAEDNGSGGDQTEDSHDLQTESNQGKTNKAKHTIMEFEKKFANFCC